MFFFYFWRSGSEEVLVEPKESCVTGARVLTAATVMYQFRCPGKTGNWIAKSEHGYHPAIFRSDGCALVSRPIESIVVKIIIIAIELISPLCKSGCKLYKVDISESGATLCFLLCLIIKYHCLNRTRKEVGSLLKKHICILWSETVSIILGFSY